MSKLTTTREERGQAIAQVRGVVRIDDLTYKVKSHTHHGWYTVSRAGDKNNNKMERMNGEIRDREKTMRGLKIEDTPILTGYQLFHNYIRPHEALDGKTPAEACGIQIQGENKWKTLIQNASKPKN